MCKDCPNTQLTLKCSFCGIFQNTVLSLERSPSLLENVAQNEKGPSLGLAGTGQPEFCRETDSKKASSPFAISYHWVQSLS